MLPKDSREEIKQYVFLSKYSKYDYKRGTKEKWPESVRRVMEMHREFYADRIDPANRKQFDELLAFAEGMYLEQRILGAQRALQYGGELLLEKHPRMYNCAGTYADRKEVFKELTYLLLCGAGTGYSVQRRHVDRLPVAAGFDMSRKETMLIPDTIEGWAEAVNFMMTNFFDGGPVPEYDYSAIRPKGAYIRGGFRAPGPVPLRKALEKIFTILRGIRDRKLTPFEVHYIMCICANAVVSGGVRRSAMIALFDADDSEMAQCKTGNWMVTMPELCRCNNSAVILPDTPKERFDAVFESVKSYGEPGFVFLDNPDFMLNPCFTGDTLVAVADGRNAVSIRELAECSVEFPVYSGKWTKRAGKYSNTWKAEIKKAKAFKTGTREVVEVRLSDGSSFRCTPEHRLALPDGTYLEAFKCVGKEVQPFFTIKEKYRIIRREKPVTDIHLTVESVTNCGTEDVYDLTVEDNHNFYIITNGDENYENCTGILVHNCAEVGMYPKHKDDSGEWHSGWGFCNLVEINGGKVKTSIDFLNACKAAAILGTLQAGYTDFSPMLTEWSEKVARRDALIGVGITGICENPDILLDPNMQRIGAECVVETNKTMARLIGVNPAARCTVVKPSGNSSQLLGTLSGITPGHSRHYIRHIQANDTEQCLIEFAKVNPEAVSVSVWNPTMEKVISFPVTLPETALLKKDITAVEFLRDVVLRTKLNWIDHGVNYEHPSTVENPKLSMNVSNTCVVRHDEWDVVREFLWDNRMEFSGVSLLPETGDLDYPQAPYMEVLSEEELVTEYGSGAILSSGLIVDALEVFANIWEACEAAMGRRPDLLELTDREIADFVLKNISSDGHFIAEVDGVCFSDLNCVLDSLRSKIAKRMDWIRRFDNFAKRYMSGDTLRTSRCLKHVDALHEWCVLSRMRQVDYSKVQWDEPVKEAGSEVATACAGGSCDFFVHKK